MRGYFENVDHKNDKRVWEDICAILKSRGAYGGNYLSIEELEEMMRMDRSRVKNILRKMADRGFVRLTRDYDMTLTDKGLKTGKKIIKKHNIIESLLMAFGVRKKTAHREALNLEHTVSNELLRELKHIGKNDELVKLTSLKEGDEGQIILLKAGRAATQRLSEMGLVPETRIKVLRMGAFKGPVEVLARDSHLVIGYELASKIYVKPLRVL